MDHPVSTAGNDAVFAPYGNDPGDGACMGGQGPDQEVPVESIEREGAMVISSRDREPVIGEHESSWSSRDLGDRPGSSPLRQMVQPEHGVCACGGKEGAIR